MFCFIIAKSTVLLQKLFLSVLQEKVQDETEHEVKTDWIDFAIWHLIQILSTYFAVRYNGIDDTNGSFCRGVKACIELILIWYLLRIDRGVKINVSLQPLSTFAAAWVKCICQWFVLDYCCIS